MKLFHSEIWRQQFRDAAVYWLLIPAAVILSGRTLDGLLGFSRPRSSPALAGSALMLMVAGIWLIDKATGDLKQYGHGTPNPFRPAKVLVTTSSYRWCRHPMFLGYDLAALGVILLCRSWAMLLASFPIMLAWQTLLLKKEEYILSRRFGKDYALDRQQVPFLVPRP